MAIIAAMTHPDAAVIPLHAPTREREPLYGRSRDAHSPILMMEAAEGGDVEAVTKQLELALLIDGSLWMGRGD